MKRPVNSVAVIVAGIALSALGCANSRTGLWNPISQLSSTRYSDETKFKVARVQEQENKLAKARGMYEELYQNGSKNVDVCHRLAIVSARMNDHTQADRYFHEAIQLAPERSDLLADYGYALFRRNNLKEAERLLKQALTLEPTNQRAANNLAITLGHQGRAEESLAAFRRVVGEAEAQANLAYIHVQRGEGRMAVERYNRALSIDKNLHKASNAMLQLAKLEQRYLQTDRAKRLIAQAKTRKAGTLESTEKTGVQLTGARKPPAHSPSEIRQASFEKVSPKPDKPKSASPELADRHGDSAKPEWLQNSPVTKPVEPLPGPTQAKKATAAAPFPQITHPVQAISRQLPDTTPVTPRMPRERAKTASPAIQHVGHTTSSTSNEPDVSDAAGHPTFKLTLPPVVTSDPAFAPTSAPTPPIANVSAALPSSAKPTAVDRTPEPQVLSVTADPKSPGWQKSLRTRMPQSSPATPDLPGGKPPAHRTEALRQPEKLRALMTADASPFAAEDQTARNPVVPEDAPARIQIQRHVETSSPVPQSTTPKGARVRLTPYDE